MESCWETFRRLLDIMLAWDWREDLFLYCRGLLVRGSLQGGREGEMGCYHGGRGSLWFMLPTSEPRE